MNDIIVNTKEDVLRERFIHNATLVGKYDFPQLPPIQVAADDLRPVPFSLAAKEKRPQDCICHFFQDDNKFERMWSNPGKYFDALENFRYIGGPDFSFYDPMPLALKIWQVYRSRALSWWLSLNGFDVIPVVGWGSPDTWEYCFDGLPVKSTLILSTNRCFSKEAKKCYIDGFRAMMERLTPTQIIVVGPEIITGWEDCVKITYFDGFGQEMENRIKEAGNDGIQKRNE